jgi:hypothetical protein
MAKKKDKAKAKKERGGAKVPKDVAGVKVPKGLRKAGKAALKLAEQPVVSEAVAAALLAAAAALRNPPATRKAAKAAGDGAADAGAAAGRQASVLGDALKAVAIDVAKRTMAAWEESGRKREASSGSGESGKAGKK